MFPILRVVGYKGNRKDFDNWNGNDNKYLKLLLILIGLFHLIHNINNTNDERLNKTLSHKIIKMCN